MVFLRFRFSWPALLAGGLLSGCHSQQAFFSFPAAVSSTAMRPDSASPTAALLPLAQAHVAAVPAPRPAPLHRARAMRHSARPTAATRPTMAVLRQPRPAHRHDTRHSAAARPRLARPTFTDRDAYVLFTALALLLGVGGILTIIFLGGGLGISLGILLLLLALFLGLVGGFLGEFASGEPFSFRELFSGKKPRP